MFGHAREFEIFEGILAFKSRRAYHEVLDDSVEARALEVQWLPRLAGSLLACMFNSQLPRYNTSDFNFASLAKPRLCDFQIRTGTKSTEILCRPALFLTNVNSSIHRSRLRDRGKSIFVSVAWRGISTSDSEIVTSKSNFWKPKYTYLGTTSALSSCNIGQFSCWKWQLHQSQIRAVSKTAQLDINSGALSDTE